MKLKARLCIAGLAALTMLGGTSASWADRGHDGRRGRHHGDTIWVRPGTGAITEAAARAESGDMLRLRRGVYVDAVNFGDKAVSVKGAGQGRTIIKAPADLPAPGENDPCAGAGLCWSAPDGPVKVKDLTTVGHANGIVGLKMDGMLVARTSGRDHDEYGIAAFESHRLTFVGNTERGDGGEAGIYIGDTDDADARVAHNTSTGWTFGFFFRDSRVGTAWGNNLVRNCIGALVLDTGPNGTGTDPESHQQFTNHPAGAWWLVGNRIVRNTRFCPAEGEGDEGAPPVGGHGVAVVGAGHVRILHNTIKGNNPPAEGESALPSSGVTIADGTNLVGSDAPRNVLVAKNRFRNELDIFWDRSGRKIRFRDNRCRTSDPDGLCD